MQNGHPSKKPEIIIVGGSLGGLSVGIALKRHGYNTTILERNPTNLLHNQGAGIVAGGDTMKFFDKYDKCKRPLAVRSERRQYLNKEGEVVHRVDMVQNMTSWDLSYYMMRANYDGIESEYCEVPAPIEGEGKTAHLYGHFVKDLKDEGEGKGVRVFYETNEGRKGSMVADMVIGADGPSSTIRNLFQPQVERTYAGYCALRGTVPESEGSDMAIECFSNRFAFYHGPGIQILAYLIPGENGSVEPGDRLINFVYYTNFPDGSEELEELLTDDAGEFHRITMPPGRMDPKVWEKRKAVAREALPPQFAELVCKTQKPFAQAVTDVMCQRNEFMGGKVCLIGDALAGFRPHTVASTSQAAFDAMSLVSYLEGEISREQWMKETMQFARLIQNRGVWMGDRSQHQDLPLKEYIYDRDIASTPHEEEVFPEWTWTKEDQALV